MIYRALKNLDAGKTRILCGQVFLTGSLPASIIDRLESLGKVAPVSTPPLAVLPGWKGRAGLLLPEIETVEQYLEAPANKLAKRLKVTPERVEQWKHDLVGYLSVPKPKG